MELPFEWNPPLKALQYQAFSTGILAASEKPGEFDWLTSFSLRLELANHNLHVYYPGDCPILLHSLAYSAKDCLDRCNLDLPNEYFRRKGGLVWKIICEMMDQGFYVYGHFNEYDVPNRDDYQIKSYLHDYLLTGYNPETMSFTLAGYTDKGIFAPTCIHLSQYVNAVSNKTDHYSSLVRFYRVKKDWSFSFDYDMARQSVASLTAKDEDLIDGNCVYGRRALTRFVKGLWDGCYEGDDTTYLQNIRAFSEHVFFVSKLLQFLSDKGYPVGDETGLTPESVVKDSSLLMFMAAKYLRTHETNARKLLCDKVGKMIATEIAALHLIEWDSAHKQ